MSGSTRKVVLTTIIFGRSIKALLFKNSQGERNKNDTWGEKDLSKYISGSAAGKGKVKADSQSAQRKQKTTADAHGSYG
jgi:hypothetical protein